MKKKINGLLVLFIILLLTGCGHEYNSIPANTFLAAFKDKDDYKVIDKTSTDQGIYKKSYEVGNGNISFYYLEFETKKQAAEYMELSYKNRNFHYSQTNNHIYAKRKISKIYIKAIKVNKMVIIGMSNKFFDRFKVDKIFRELKL